MSNFKVFYIYYDFYKVGFIINMPCNFSCIFNCITRAIVCSFNPNQKVFAIYAICT